MYVSEKKRIGRTCFAGLLQFAVEGGWKRIVDTKWHFAIRYSGGVLKASKSLPCTSRAAGSDPKDGETERSKLSPARFLRNPIRGVSDMGGSAGTFK